jgi:hypothetical protein
MQKSNEIAEEQHLPPVQKQTGILINRNIDHSELLVIGSHSRPQLVLSGVCKTMVRTLALRGDPVRSKQISNLRLRKLCSPSRDRAPTLRPTPIPPNNKATGRIVFLVYTKEPLVLQRKLYINTSKLIITPTHSNWP